MSPNRKKLTRPGLVILIVLLFATLLMLSSLRHNQTVYQQQQTLSELHLVAIQDSLYAAEQKRKADSVIAQNKQLLSGNERLLVQSEKLDSMLRLQTDSTERARLEMERARLEADFLREQARMNSSHLMALGKGQAAIRVLVDSVRYLVDSVRHESRNLAESYYQWSQRENRRQSDSIAFALQVIDQYKDSLDIKTRSLLKVNHGAVSDKKKKSGSSINAKRRQRQQARRIRQRRRNSLLKG